MFNEKRTSLIIWIAITITLLLAGCGGNPTNPNIHYAGQMINIPAGSFMMGNNGSEPYSNPEELPQHSVYLSAYSIGKYEVTRGDYKTFMADGGYSNQSYWSSEGWSWKETQARTQPDYWNAEQNWGTGPAFTQTDGHPVVGVSYYEAEAFCNWAGGHLPTEAQWEKAARWNGKNSYVYPWGNIYDPEKSNNMNDSQYQGYQTAPVGLYPSGASPYGCEDMAGNVDEWCKDWYARNYYSESPTNDPQGPVGPASSNYNIARGSNWYHADEYAKSYSRCAYRYSIFQRGEGNTGTGFRVAN